MFLYYFFLYDPYLFWSEWYSNLISIPNNILFSQRFFKISIMPCFTMYNISLFFSHFFYFQNHHRSVPTTTDKGRCCVTAHLASQQSDTPQGGTTADTWAARISMIGPNELRLSSTSVLRSREREFGYCARLKLKFRTRTAFKSPSHITIAELTNCYDACQSQNEISTLWHLRLELHDLSNLYFFLNVNCISIADKSTTQSSSSPWECLFSEGFVFLWTLIKIIFYFHNINLIPCLFFGLRKLNKNILFHI